MRVSRQQWLLLAFALALQGCASSTEPRPQDARSYFWLPQLEAPDSESTRLRAEVSAALDQHGFVQTGNPSIALALSSDADVSDDGSMGFGIYAGGYAYYPATQAPRGYVQVVAFDAQTLQPIWRMRWRPGEAMQELQAANTTRRPS